MATSQVFKYITVIRFFCKGALTRHEEQTINCKINRLQHIISEMPNQKTDIENIR